MLLAESRRTTRITDWTQILRLSDQLFSLDPSPIVALNRAVAVAEVEGADAALALVDRLDLDGYQLFHAIRADLLQRLGHNAEATLAYDAAIAPHGERNRARLPAPPPSHAHLMANPAAARTASGQAALSSRPSAAGRSQKPSEPLI
jgi:RNA polymerase sigma-70 factor (ECF subfamily)